MMPPLVKGGQGRPARDVVWSAEAVALSWIVIGAIVMGAVLRWVAS